MTTVSSNRGPAMGLSAAAAAAAPSHPYTCNTCQVAFRNSDLQKGHMRSDWHRYNLKRRVTSLPPITSETFTEKVLAAQASSSAAATKASYERTCSACEKTYFSENSYYNHVGSQKHRSRLAILQGSSGYIADDTSSSVLSSNLPSDLTETVLDSGGETDITEVVEGIKGTSLDDGRPIDGKRSIPGTGGIAAASDDRKERESSETSSELASEPMTPTVNLRQCLFCNYESPTIDLNVTHMERAHGMFIPERNYLVDLNGLISALFEKINEFHECLYCGKLKPSVFGLQTHMRDMGHCKIPFQTEDEQLEIGEFYDFTSTYSDVDEEESEGNAAPATGAGSRLNAKRINEENGDECDEMEDADGWETDSSASSLDSDDLTAVPLDQHMHQYEKLNRHPHHSSQDPRPHRNKDGWHSHAHKHAHAAFYSDYELHLPSGRSVGHRSLNKYYRQNLHNHPTLAEQQERSAIMNSAASDSEMENQHGQEADRERGREVVSRANGGMGMIGVTAQKQREVQAVERKARKVEERERRRFQWGNNRQNNFQKHYRDPLLQ